MLSGERLRRKKEIEKKFQTAYNNAKKLDEEYSLSVTSSHTDVYKLVIFLYELAPPSLHAKGVRFEFD